MTNHPSRSQVAYEWHALEMDGDEIAEIFVCGSYADAVRATKKLPGSLIQLVREHGADRSWATVQDGMLPAEFSYGQQIIGAVVPKRFHTEVAKHQ